MAAKNPIRFRSYSSGAPLNKTFRLYRDGANVLVEDAERNTKKEHNFLTVTLAKKAMSNPATIVG